MRIAIDTNVLVYAEGVGDAAKQDQALSAMERLRRHTVALPVQVLGELFNVLLRTARFSPRDVHQKVVAWSNDYALIFTTAAVMTTAAVLAAEHRLNIWDAVILTAAADADCHLLLSEDMQDGFLWRGVTVANPFAAKKHPLLASVLDR